MKALLIVDVQNDFCPGGALGVKDGDKIIPVINELQNKFDLIIATQDWHPKNHKSFAMWTMHCVQGSKGAEFPQALNTSKLTKIFKKATNVEIDSYSGFFDNDHKTSTGLSKYLKEKKVDDVYIVGLATDYCVKFTALDSIKLGFKTNVIENGCKGINLNKGDVEKALQELKSKGVNIIKSSDI